MATKEASLGKKATHERGRDQDKDKWGDCLHRTVSVSRLLLMSAYINQQNPYCFSQLESVFVIGTSKYVFCKKKKLLSSLVGKRLNRGTSEVPSRAEYMWTRRPAKQRDPLLTDSSCSGLRQFPAGQQVNEKECSYSILFPATSQAVIDLCSALANGI